MTDGFVLAGGRSSRMGVDKARVPFPEHRPMALFVADRLREVCGRVALVRRDVLDPLPWPEGTEVVFDAAPPGDAHPLWGVGAALSAARSELVVLAPCDLPWLTGEALQALVDAAPAVGAGSSGVEPLLCVLPAAWASAALNAARDGASARSFVDRCVRVRLPDAVIRDLDCWSDSGRPGPVRALLDGLTWLDDASRSRIAAAERVRLAQAGMLDPELG